MNQCYFTVGGMGGGKEIIGVRGGGGNLVAAVVAYSGRSSRVDYQANSR